MKYNQNFKIMQVTERTLVIGVDIAKKVHTMQGPSIGGDLKWIRQ